VRKRKKMLFLSFRQVKLSYSCNNNGMRLISPCSLNGHGDRKHIIPTQKYIYKASWKSPDGRMTNQIDHALIDHSHKSCLQAVRIANIDSDHFLIIPKICSRINEQYITPRTTGHKIHDIKKLDDPEVVTRYMNNLKSQTEMNKNASELDNGNWTICK
jgi:hypothetical protein